MFEESLTKYYEIAAETYQSMDSFLKKCEAFQQVWRYRFHSVDKCTLICVDAKKEMEFMKDKLMKKSLKCVIIGRVSSGKSTLINALLLKNIVPKGICCRTNCFIEVKKSLNGRMYMMVGDEEKDIKLLNDLADDFSPGALPQGTHIELFYSSDNNTLFAQDIIIMDTPGFDGNTELDDMIVEECIDADVIILAVSSMIGLGETERYFIRKHQTIFTKFNVFLLYSLWDQAQSENIEKSNNMKARLLRQAKQYLENDLQVSSNDFEDRIFFISAEDKLSSLSNMHDTIKQDKQNRIYEFDKFVNQLQLYLSKSSQNKRINVLYNISGILDTLLKEIDFCFEDIKIKKKEFGLKLRDDLSILLDFNDKIYSEVKESFKETYNHFFDQSLNIIKNNVIINEQEIINKLNNILLELIVVTVESLKRRIVDLIELNKNDQNEHCINIIRTLYFPFYFNLEKEIKCFEMDFIYRCFAEINRVKKIGAGLSIAGAVIGSAATLASGGILAGVILPIPTLMGASALGFAGAAVGGSAGGGISSALLSINREAFSTFYKKSEDIIKASWKQMELPIMNSYNLFLEQLPSKVDAILEPLNEECYSLPNKMNFLKSEANRIKNLQ